MFKLRFMASRVLKTNKLDMSFPFGASSSSIQLELWQITVLCHRLSPVHIAPSTEATMHCNNLHFSYMQLMIMILRYGYHGPAQLYKGLVLLYLT